MVSMETSLIQIAAIVAITVWVTRIILMRLDELTPIVRDRLMIVGVGVYVAVLLVLMAKT